MERYMTDGMLLREIMSDPLLMRYGIVILDEGKKSHKSSSWENFKHRYTSGNIKSVAREEKEVEVIDNECNTKCRKISV